MKVALVHDYIKEYGGAERVLEALHEIWPEAPVYTTVYLPSYLGPHQTRFKTWKIITSAMQHLPFAEKLISPLRLFSPLVFENWDFREFDLIIVSATGAYFPNLILTRPDAIHISYCHTPPRYLYGYKTARNWQKNIVGKILGEFFNHHLRQVDFVASQRPDYIIANSREVQQRITKFYRREAEVIYPPVGMVDRITNHESRIKGDRKVYYLTGGRLARAKHIDLAIEACNKLKVPLKVFGRGFAGYENELKSIAGKTVEFVGEVTEEKLIDLYKGAKALIYPSEDEDFGILAVEAQACGTPLIGFRSGGVKETVTDGKTGILFDELTVDSIVKAIKQLNSSVIKPEDCMKNARRFSKDRFKREIQNFIKQKTVNNKQKKLKI